MENQKHGGSPSRSASCSALTPDVLKTLKFGLRMHLNGGNKHSARVTGNDEYGLSWTRKTNGSPEYLITEDILEVDGNPEIRVDMRAEDRDIEGFCRAYNEWRQSSPDADRRSATEIDVEEIIAASDKAKAERAEKLPDEESAIHAMWEAYHRLEELGWKNAIYCPKDGTMFKAIEPGSTGIHDCMYQGEWPDGSWWTVWEGDMGPSRPILFKLNRFYSKCPDDLYQAGSFRGRVAGKVLNFKEIFSHGGLYRVR